MSELTPLVVEANTGGWQKLDYASEQTPIRRATSAIAPG